MAVKRGNQADFLVEMKVRRVMVLEMRVKRGNSIRDESKRRSGVMAEILVEMRV